MTDETMINALNKLLEEFHRLERVIDKRLERIENALVEAMVTISGVRHDISYLLPDDSELIPLSAVQELIKRHGAKKAEEL